ncbi:MAG: hypothetical protein FJ189_08465 [Gammaproteobacteria bacterium]|nr:hypothetical protein [Gammaproteobacteria bacterium]
MKKSGIRCLSALALLVVTTAGHGEVALTDAAELLGKWQLESVAPGIKKARIAENRVWEFRADGTIVTSGHNRILGGEDRYEWKYRLVDGKIIADDPGRPGKTMEYVVYEKDADGMILKGGLEGFYFFKKQ